MKKKIANLVIVFSLSMLLIGIRLNPLESKSALPLAIDSVEPLTGMGNPAAVYCQETGYEFRTAADGKGEKGLCALPDGQVCEAWSFLEGKCGLEHAYCSQLGLQAEVREISEKGNHTQVICLDESNEPVGAAVDLLDLQDTSLGCGVNLESTTTLDQAQPEPLEALDFAPPASFDWRSYNGIDWVSPVKNQLTCGSCWAFSAASVAQSAINISVGDPDHSLFNHDLSEEYLVADCYQEFDGYGNCCGGRKSDALSYIRDYGIPDEDCLPYAESCGCDPNYPDQICGSNCNYRTDIACSDRTCADRCPDWESRLATIQSTSWVSSDPTVIKQALIHYGPLAVSMDWEGYGSWPDSGGFDGDVYRCKTDTSTNHAVVIIGYNDTGGYWLVRNSWGTGFGDGGDFKIGYGECQIEDYVYYASNNQDPWQPANPSPADSTELIGVSSLLEWEGGDPNPADSLTYDVYLDAGDPTPETLICVDSPEVFCDPGQLDYNTDYYFQVVAYDNRGGSQAGPIWTFSTVVQDPDGIGLYSQDTAEFKLKNQLSDGPADATFVYGAPGTGWSPLAGDWNLDAADSVGLWNPLTSKWYLRNSNDPGAADVVFRYGPADMGWIPLSGDWDNDGVDSAGLYNPLTSKFYLRNSLSGGPADLIFRYGPAGLDWVPLVGDWDQNGVDSVGLYNPVTGKFYFRNSLSDGKAEITFKYGPGGEGWKPVVGDWDGDGIDTVGLYKPDNSKWYLRNSNTAGAADQVVNFGPSLSDYPLVVGDWE